MVSSCIYMETSFDPKLLSSSGLDTRTCRTCIETKSVKLQISHFCIKNYIEMCAKYMNKNILEKRKSI